MKIMAGTTAVEEYGVHILTKAAAERSMESKKVHF
jgi:hypothetical protein